MNKIKHTSVHIRRKDEEIFSKLLQLNFSEFVSDMMSTHGQDYIADKVQEEIKKLNKIYHES